jgi:hypothetical protein
MADKENQVGELAPGEVALYGEQREKVGFFRKRSRPLRENVYL